MFWWICLTSCFSLILGVFLTLCLQWYLLSQPLGPQRPPPLQDTNSVFTDLPQVLLDELEKLGRLGADSVNDVNDEAVLAVNLLVHFFFRQWRSQGSFRRFVLNKVNQEMEEILSKGAVNKIIKGMKICDLELGSRAPTIGRIGVSRVKLDDRKREIDAVDFDMDVDYSGGIGIAIDLALAYNKSAFLSAKVSRLIGRVQLAFSRQPFSHWSLTFTSTPQMEVDVTSRVAGRSFSHVTQLVASQIQKWIQKKHTLPTKRIRFKPFFPPPDRLLQPVPSKTGSIRSGTLEVTVLQCSRLNHSFTGDAIYCSLALDNCPWLNMTTSDAEGYSIMDIRVIRKRDQPLGLIFQQPSPTRNFGGGGGGGGGGDDGKELRGCGIVILDVEPRSAGDDAGFRTGDKILQVNGNVIRSTEDILRAVTVTKDQYWIMKVERYLPTNKMSPLIPAATLMDYSSSPSVSSDDGDDKLPLISTTPPAEELPELGVDCSLHPDCLNEMPGLEMKRTATVPLAKVMTFDDAQKLQVNPSHRFLNVTVWLSHSGDASGGRKPHASPIKSPSSVSKANLSSLFKSRTPEKARLDASSLLLHSSPQQQQQQQQQQQEQLPGAHPEVKETAIGHVNISLADIAADCMLNTQGHHISTYQLHPADIKATLAGQHQLTQQPGFEPRLCYGDVILSFVYRPQEEGSSGTGTYGELHPLDVSFAYVEVPSPRPTPSPSPLPPSPVEDTPTRPLPPGGLAVNGSKRPHEFLLTHFVQVRLCDFCRKKIWLREALQCGGCGVVCHKKCIKRYPEDKWCTIDPSGTQLGDLFLPARATHPPLDASKVDGSSDNPFLVSAQDDVDLDEMELLVLRLQSRNHDESLIRLAKDSGKGIFSHLTNSQRRLKISSAIVKLESAIEAETTRRNELSSSLDRTSTISADERKQVQARLNGCNSRSEALILLLLHYSTGMQSVEEAEQHCDQ